MRNFRCNLRIFRCNFAKFSRGHAPGPLWNGRPKVDLWRHTIVTKIAPPGNFLRTPLLVPAIFQALSICFGLTGNASGTDPKLAVTFTSVSVLLEQKIDFNENSNNHNKKPNTFGIRWAFLRSFAQDRVIAGGVSSRAGVHNMRPCTCTVIHMAAVH